MASYAGAPQTYQPALPTYNFEVIGKALQYKQGEIDKNYLQTQELLDTFGEIDLARDVDKNYLSSKLQNVVTQINSVQGADWSSQNVAGILQGHIKDAIDQNVVNAAISTKNFRTLQSDIQHYKTKETDKYNPLNEAFAMRGANAWLADPNAGAGYSGGSYNPYVDVDKTMLAVVKDLKETKGDQVIEVPIVDAQGNHRLQKKTIKGLTSQEIQAYLPNIMPTNVNQQLQINGWGKYQGQGGLAVAQEVYNGYVQDKNSEFDRQIEAAKIGETATGISKSQKMAYSNSKQALMQQKSNFATQISNVNPNDTASIGGFIETNRWINNFSQIAGARESVEYDNDTAYYAQKGLELDYAKEARQQEEFKLSTIKTGLEIAKLQGELTAANAPTISLSPDLTPTTENIDPYANTMQRYGDLTKQVNAVSTSVYAEASEEKQKLYDDKKTTYIKAGNSEANANYLAFQAVFGQSNPQAAQELIKVQTDRLNQGKILQQSKQEAVLREFEENGREYYNDLTRLASVDTKAAKFIKDNNITAQTLTNRRNNTIIAQAAELLGNVEPPVGMYSRAALGEYGTSGSVAAPNNRNPLTEAQKRAGEIIVEKGYSGFAEKVSANLLSEKDRELVSNSIYNTSDGGVFVKDKPITILKNADGSLTASQNINPDKEGQQAPRVATISKNSDLYNFITSKINPVADRTQRLSGATYTPMKSMDYIDDSDKVAVRKNSDFLLNRTGGTLTPSGVSPINYITASNTKKVYKAGLPNINPQKIDALVSLMEQNPNKIKVKTSVDDGQYIVTTLIDSAIPYKIGVDSGGDETNADNINLYVQQYPQISAGEAILQKLRENPEEIDNMINALQQ